MQLKIKKLVYGGEGLGHCDGRTVFVPYVLPDEVVRVQPVEQKKKFVRGRLIELVEASAMRSAPACAHFTACGGCHYQHIPYAEQLRYKEEILRETLRRVGRIGWDAPITTHPSPALGYRNRAQWKVRAAEGGRRMGYFRGGSTALCPVDACPVLSPRLAEALAALGARVAAGELPETLREVEVFADAGDSRLLLNASLAEFPGAPAEVAETLRRALPGIETLLLHESSRDRFELFGPGYLHYEAAGQRYRVGHLSFFQANRFLLDELIRVVASDRGGDLALDLFAGVGVFAVALTATFQQVVAVEANPAAFRDLETNLAGRAACAIHLDVKEYLQGCTEKPGLVVLDPPRGGVEAAALEGIAALGPERITYVSCDPATLARDLEALARSGYATTELHLFDMFPQTYHVETVARLERRG